MIRDFKNEIETMEASEWLGVVFGIFITMVIISIICLIIKKGVDSKNASCPMQQMKARVVDKQNLPGNAIRSMSTMWVVFELENGLRKRMIIPATKDDMVVGDVGILSWQGEAMVAFSRNSMAGRNFTSGYTSTTPSVENQGYIPAWKRVETMEAEKAAQGDMESPKCMFCGAKMLEDQVFCGSCGRRKD